MNKLCSVFVTLGAFVAMVAPIHAEDQPPPIGSGGVTGAFIVQPVVQAALSGSGKPARDAAYPQPIYLAQDTLSDIEGGPIQDIKKGWNNFMKDLGRVGEEIKRSENLRQQGQPPPSSKLRIALLLRQNLPAESHGANAFPVIVSGLAAFLRDEKGIALLKELSGPGQAPNSPSDFLAQAQGLPGGSFGIMEIQFKSWKKLARGEANHKIAGYAEFDIQFRFAGKANGLADDSPSRWARTVTVRKSIDKEQWEAYLLKVLKNSYDLEPGQDIEFRPVFLALVVQEAFAKVADSFPKPAQ